MVSMKRSVGRPRRHHGSALGEWYRLNTIDLDSLAQEIECSPAYLANILSGAELPGVALAKRIKRRTGLSLDAILDSGS